MIHRVHIKWLTDISKYSKITVANVSEQAMKFTSQNISPC